MSDDQCRNGQQVLTEESISDADAAQSERIVSEDVIDEILGPRHAGFAEELAHGSAETALLRVNQLTFRHGEYRNIPSCNQVELTNQMNGN